LRNFLNEQVNMFPSFGFFTLVSLCQNWNVELILT
jgi:hypothetical protein